jgi:hypothetical protein
MTTATPSYIVYHRDDKQYATPLGEARAHGDGKGFDIDVRMLPIAQSSVAGGEFDGRLTIRAIDAKTHAAAA